MHLFALLSVFFATLVLVSADTPANCTYQDIQGIWLFAESDRVANRTENCDDFPSKTNPVYIKLDFPNIATDSVGNVGTWTLIYNQGFEVIINLRRYFAFSLYKQKGKVVTSYCNATLPGWSHDVLGHNWACIKGRKVDSFSVKPVDLHQTFIGEGKMHRQPNGLLFEAVNMSEFLSESYVQKINSRQSQWRAKVYPQLQKLNTEELIKMAGGRASRIVSKPRSATNEQLSEELNRQLAQLPDSFDWRNVNGVNYVSPIRNQGLCGSCYAYSSMGILEARVRIATNNSETPVFSTQQVVDCSEYSQGCEGGFPYLVAGKYAQDFGVMADQCYPYVGKDGSCKAPVNNSITCQKRTYTYQYNYIGGYYGACNEDLMRLELVKNGPISVSFEVYPDFMNYASGVYVHDPSSLDDNSLRFNPFELTNHAVLAVGYGFDQLSQKPYWIVKNSWGPEWGMNGYFWIERGVDECAIESLAVAVMPIP